MSPVRADLRDAFGSDEVARQARARRTASVAFWALTVLTAGVIAFSWSGPASRPGDIEYSVIERSYAAGGAWQLEAGDKDCRRVTFTPALRPLTGYESNALLWQCGPPPAMFGDSDPMEVLAIGRSGSRVVVAIDTAPEIKAIPVDGQVLRPSAKGIVVYTGDRPPGRINFHAAGWSGACWLDRQGSPVWWMNCEGSHP